MARLVRLPLVATLLCASIGTGALGAANIPSQFAGRILAAQNMLRAEAGMPPLSWDPSLAHGAAIYAIQLAFTNKFQHSNPTSRGRTGENLWMGTRGAYSYESMIAAWASERRYFVPGVFPRVSRTGNWEDVGHYTQMVWPTTIRVGCALASNARTDFLVCRYAPAGNINGRSVRYDASANAPFDHLSRV